MPSSRLIVVYHQGPSRTPPASEAVQKQVVGTANMVRRDPIQVR